MRLKTFSVYRFTRPLIVDLGDLNAALGEFYERPLGALERGNDGFTPPLPKYSQDRVVVLGNHEARFRNNDGEFTSDPYKLTHDSDVGLEGATVITYFREEKVIVGPHVKRLVEQRVEQIQSEEGRQVYRGERNEINDAVVAGILPHAQSRYTTIPLVFLANGLLVVGATGAKAELALGKLREVMGMLPVVPVEMKLEIPKFLTRLAFAQRDGENETPFQITDDFQIQSVLAGHNSIARCKNTDITDENIAAFIESGLAVTHARLMWGDEAAFTLDFKGNIKSLKIDNIVFDEIMNEQGSGEYDVAADAYGLALIEVVLVSKLIVSLYTELSEFSTDLDGAKPVSPHRAKPTENPSILKDLHAYICSSRAKPGMDEGGEDEE